VSGREPQGGARRPARAASRAGAVQALAALLVPAVVLLAWAAAATASVDGNANVNYFSTQTSTQGLPGTSSSTMLQNYSLNVAGPITPKVLYTGYVQATRTEQSTQTGDIEQRRYLTALQPEVQLTLQDPLYSLSSGYRRLESWNGSGFSDSYRNTSNYYFARMGITPLRLPVVSLQFDRQESFNYSSPMSVNQTTTNVLADVNYAWKYLRAYYSFNASRNDNKVAGQGDTVLNHVGRLDYSQPFGGGKYPVSISYQVNSTDAPVGAPVVGGGFANPVAGTLGSATNDVLLGPQFTNLGGWDVANLALNEAGRNLGISLPTAAVINQIVLDLQQVGAVAASAWDFAVYAKNDTDSSWRLLGTVNVGRTSNLFIISFANNQTFKLYKVVNITADISVPPTTVSNLRAFNVQVTGQAASTQALSQALNMNTGARVSPEINVAFNFFMDKLDRGPDSFFGAAGKLFGPLFTSSVSRPGAEGSFSSVTRSFGPTVSWLPARWMTANFSYQRQDSFDSDNLNNSGNNTYSATFNISPLASLDASLSYVRTQQNSQVRSSVANPVAESNSTSDSYFASVTARLIEGLDWVSDAGYTTSGQTGVTAAAASGYFLHQALNVQWTPRLFSTVNYSLNWATNSTTSAPSVLPSALPATSTSTVSRVGNLVIGYRPTNRINTSYNISTSSSGSSRLLSQAVAFDWLILPAIHFHASAGQARISPQSSTTRSALAQLIYNVNRYVDLQAGYTLTTQSTQVIGTTTQAYNVFFNGRF
jgi:hypothetical protein